MFLFSPAIRIFWEGRWAGGYVEPRRRLYDCELVYVSAGAFQLEIDGVPHRMRAGSIAVIPPGSWHESRVPPAGYAVRHCVHFDWLPDPISRTKPVAGFPGERYDVTLVNPVPPEIARHLPLVGHFDAKSPLVAVIDIARPCFRNRDSTASAMLWPVLQLLLSTCSGHPRAAPPRASNTHAVLQVREYIDANFTKPQSYATYRRISGLSTSHLCQLFTSVFGRPPFAYLVNLRLQHACRLLRETDWSVKRVAYAVGIPDPNYFSRIFRRHFGQSPSKWCLAGR